MKKLWLLLILPVILISCGTDPNEVENEDLEDNFKVSGLIEGASNTTLYVEALSQNGAIQVATGKTDAKGNFELKGNIPGMGLYQLRVGEAQDKAIPLTLVPEDHVKINSTFNEFTVKPNVSNTSWSPVMNRYLEMFATFAEAQQSLSAMQNQMSQDEMMEKYAELRKPIDEFCAKEMTKDPGNPFNIVLSTSLSPTSGFKYWNPEYLDVLKVVAEEYLQKYEGNPIAAAMDNQVYQIEMAYQEYQNSASGGKTAPEIALKNPMGITLKLSSLRGKYVLIDFWASWCGPCRKENPNVVRLYKKYKDKGFTIFSVSLDQDAQAWKAAIGADGLEWPNHVSDLLGWNSSMPALYGFNGIPHTVLIDKEGKIIATGLRGPTLEQKLVELFGK
ncbi:MAG: AhpC/TSA family protein [Bacteroidetes bacterium]|nr:MAG: AhpC/TSA family protein [Bacteroidota bacterium]